MHNIKPHKYRQLTGILLTIMTILGHDRSKCCRVDAVAAAAKNTKTAETKATNPTIKHKICTASIPSRTILPKALQNRNNKSHDKETTIKEPYPIDHGTKTDPTSGQETVVAASYTTIP